MRTGARLDLHGIGGEKVRHHFKIGRVADLDQGVPPDGRLAFLTIRRTRPLTGARNSMRQSVIRRSGADGSPKRAMTLASSLRRISSCALALERGDAGFGVEARLVRLRRDHAHAPAPRPGEARSGEIARGLEAVDFVFGQFNALGGDKRAELLTRARVEEAGAMGCIAATTVCRP